MSLGVTKWYSTRDLIPLSSDTLFITTIRLGPKTEVTNENIVGNEFRRRAGATSAAAATTTTTVVSESPGRESDPSIFIS